MRHIEAAILSGEPSLIASSIQYINLFISVSSFDMKKLIKFYFFRHFLLFSFFLNILSNYLNGRSLSFKAVISPSFKGSNS